LWLHQQLQQQSDFKPLQAGEIIATGSWTKPQPVKRGEVWSSAFGQLNVPGLSVSFN
jgi:2-keto-4-pentenoate hydratase